MAGHKLLQSLVRIEKEDVISQLVGGGYQTRQKMERSIKWRETKMGHRSDRLQNCRKVKLLSSTAI